MSVSSLELSVSEEALFGAGLGTGVWNTNQEGATGLPNGFGNTPVDSRTFVRSERSGNNLDDVGVVEENVNPNLNLRIIDQLTEPLPGQNIMQKGAIPKNPTLQATENNNSDPVVRNKIFKNKENNKNANNRSTNTVCNPSSENETSFVPKLQFKNYDDDLENTSRKTVNFKKQKKQKMNETRQTQSSVEDESLSSNLGLPMVNGFQMPGNLSPNANPRDVMAIDNRRRTNHVLAPADSDFHSVHHRSKKYNNGNKENKSSGQTTSRLGETNNCNRIQNDLWSNKNGDKNKRRVPLVQPFDGPSNLENDDLEEDSDNTTILKLANSQHEENQFHVPSPNLVQPHPIIVPYVHNNTETSNKLQLSPPVLDTQHLVQERGELGPISSMLPNRGSSDSLTSLPSNLSSNVLFGSGDQDDYFFAQKLQQKYDRENADTQTGEHYDILPGNALSKNDPQRLFLTENTSDFGQQQPYFNTTNGNQLDPDSLYFTAAQNQASIPVSLPNVYDPSESKLPDSANNFPIPAELSPIEEPRYRQPIITNSRDDIENNRRDKNIASDRRENVESNRTEINLSNRRDNVASYVRENTPDSNSISNRRDNTGSNGRDIIIGSNGRDIIIGARVVSADNDHDSVTEETKTVPQQAEIVIPFGMQNDHCQQETLYPDYEPCSDDSTGIDYEHPHMSIQEEGARNDRERSSDLDDETFARLIQEQLNMDVEKTDEEYARYLQEREEHTGPTERRVPLDDSLSEREDAEYQPLRTRVGNTWNRPLRVGPSAGNNNVFDSRIRGQSTWERPLARRNPNFNTDFSYLDTTHNIPTYRERGGGYDIPPGQDYYYRYEMDPDYGDEHLVSISRDPHMLASLLLERAPDMMIPNEVDLNDYEALWELAEGLGEVRRVGMEESDISLLPVHTYTAPGAGVSDSSKTDCNVCLAEFKSGEKLRTLPCCHMYHVECIDEWLKRNAVCPVCRQSASQRQ